MNIVTNQMKSHPTLAAFDSLKFQIRDNAVPAVLFEPRGGSA